MLRSGHLNSGATDLLIGSGTRLTFGLIDFSYGNGSGTIGQAFSNGTLEGAFSRGTTIAMSSGVANPTQFVLDDASEVTLAGVELSVVNQKVTKLAFHNESSLKLNILDGCLALAGQSMVHIENAKLVATITNAEWAPGQKPNVSGTINFLSINVNSGILAISPGCVAHIVTGRLKATDLTLNSLQTPIITGPLSVVSCEIAADDRLIITDQLGLTTAAGSRIEANNSLSVVSGASYLIGTAVIDAHFRDFGTADKSFSICEGSLHLPLQVSSGGVVTSPYTQSSGGVAMVADRDCFTIQASRLIAALPSGGVTNAKVQATVGITNGKILPGSSVEALWSASIDSFVISTVVPATLQKPKGDDNDARLFPVRVQAALSVAATARHAFSASPLKFSGGKISTNVAFPLDIVVTIPPGAGEYRDRDDVSKGGKGGGDEYSHSQEVWRDKFGFSTYHFYLMPRDYTFSCNIKLINEGSALNFGMSDMSTTDPFNEHEAWCTDGGGLNSIITALAGSLFGPLGAACGYIAVEKVEDLAKTHVPEMIRSRLGSQSFNTIIQ